MTSSESRGLHDALFTTAAMRSVFADTACVQRMLDFEAALARAEARTGVIPSAAAEAITRCCRAEHFDQDALAAAAGEAGNLAIPLVKALTALVARDDASAAGFVHWGATSQDAIDTGLVLQMRDALDLLAADQAALARELAVLADAQSSTLLAGRTWLQQALPIPFGIKVAGWLSAVERDRVRFAALRARLLVVQFGGAAGTLASLGDRGIEVSEALADELALGLPDLPWHTQRDRVAEAACVLGIAIGTLGKMARDWSLLMQTEVGEAFEPAAPGRGGSSTLPHKRNPVSAAVVLAAATRAPGLVATMLGAMVQEHERGLGGWHAEWTTLPELFDLSAGALAHTVRVIAGLELDGERMRANLDLTHGLLAAEAIALTLGRTLGKEAGHRLLEKACRTAITGHRHLRDVLAAMPEVRDRIAQDELERLFDPARDLGVADAFIARVLAAHRA